MSRSFLFIAFSAVATKGAEVETDAVNCVSTEEDSCLLQASIDKHSQSVNASAGELKCFEKAWYYEPNINQDGGRIETESASKCQAHCLMFKGCKHFSYWPDKGCELQAADALKKPATEEKYYGVLSGNKRGCSCFDSGKYWQPNMPDMKSYVKNAEQCQEECVWEKKCEAFSFWPDGGCQLQALGKGSELVVATNPKYLGVVTGPKIGCECFTMGWYYMPTMGKEFKLTVGNEYECQNHCYMTKGCKTFSFWPDGGCELQDATAEKTKVKNVEFETVVSGPKRGCFSIER